MKSLCIYVSYGLFFEGNANIHLVMNGFGTLFHDKIFSLTIPWLLTTFLTFPWRVSNSLTFPGFPDKWSPCPSSTPENWWQLVSTCRHPSSLFDNDRQRLSVVAMTAVVKWWVPVINNMAVKHHEGETETLDSSTVRISLGDLPHPILGLRDRLIRTTTTRY